VIALDPDFAGGYAGLAFNYSVQIRFQYSASPASHLAEAFELANKAIEIDPSYTWGYIALGGAHLANVDADAAVDAVRQALLLEPNGYEANLFMGFYLQFAGNAARAVEHLQVSKRLSPVESVRDRAFMALAQFMNRNYAEVVRMSWTSTLNGMVVLAAAHTLLEKPEEATGWVKKLLDTNPDFNLSQLKLTLLRYYQLEENRTRLYNAAKKAGIPEFPKSQ
jgi:tetratricopeptide (TPR) repeat protein